jgi:subtilisin family serine protease
MLYLKNHVRPVIQKVSNGNAVSLTEYNLVAKTDKAQEIINTEKDTTATSYAETKKIKSTETVSGTSTVGTVDSQGDVQSSTSSWATVNAGGGQEKRTVTTTTPNYRTTTTTPCTIVRKTLLNGTTVDSACTYGTAVVETTTLDPTISAVDETREGDNPVETSETLEATVNTVTETGNQYVVTNYADAEDTDTTTTNGTAVTTTANRDVVTDVNNGDNTTTRTTVRYVDTTITTPVTTTVTRTRTYTDNTKQNTRTITTTTPQTKVTYKDSTFETISGTATVVTSDWTINQISTAIRTEEMPVSETTADTVSTSSNSGTQVAQVTISNAYTDDDTTLGTKTANMSTVVNDHKTTEYNTNTGLNTINAADAYAKGWTGKGSVLGVIDTYQQTNHPELNGKYKWYNDFTRYDNTVSTSGNQQVHGTHVAGIIAGKRDGTGNHGVAFDAELVGANVDYYGHGGISKSRAQQALHDFAKLKDSNGENLNIVAVNMSWNTPTLFTDHNGSTVTQLSDGTYDASEITSRMNVDDGQAKYYKIATDNDMILVNSAGNYGFNHAGDPGIWATEVDASGNLILGGKMIIVGNWDGTNVAGNKAGHVCLKIVNNACNDTNKISDFYILAPGDDIYSSTPTHLSGNGYMNMSGTSMAAPHVTGAFGVINQMWPHMKGDNLVKLVLATADKNLTGYNVNIHGQGLLDLDEATKPQGAIGIPTTGRTNGPIVGTYGTYFSTGTALPSALGDLKVMILDEYERDYYINLGSTMVVKDMRKVSDIDMMMNGNTYLPVQSMYGNFTQGGNYDLGFMNFGLYTGANGGGDFTGNIGKNFMLSNNLKFKTSVGQMNEQDNWLGNASDGVLAVGDNNVTNFGQFGIEYALGNNVISFDYSKGFTDINTTDNSLITGFNNVETESMKVAYEIHNDANNTWGFSLSTPSHITNGTMNLLVPESRTLDGTVNYANIESDMSSSTIEKDIGFFYNHTPVNDMDASFNFKAEYRQDISGVAGNDGVNLAFNYVKKLNTNCKFLWMKNPRCFEKNENGKEILKANLYHNNNEDTNATKHGLVYDLKTDKFIPIKK